MVERCRECAHGLFDRRRTGNTVNRQRVVSRYPPDGSLRPRERIHCSRCGTPYRVRYDRGSLTWRLRQDGPPEMRRTRL